MVKRLGELERAVMDVLWDRGEPAVVRDVVRALADREPAYTTVMTVLDRLARKGFARREMAGRAWRYSPSASREEYVSRLMLDALSQAGDRSAALVQFAQSVSSTEAELLGQALADAEREDDRGGHR